ncbi:hypothetical protein ACFZC6_32075 [Streptomyces ossamyceticus]|uniref:hypothetical protein n=1 Tax=Streptomyces ossamyceticus TaxID=249581 RepID=UPI0036E07008
MAWDEWEQLKTAAAERQSTHMQINHVAPEPGGSAPGGSAPATGTLRSDKATWSKAGVDVGNLRESIGKALRKLSAGNTGLGDAVGVQTAAAQKAVYDSWERRVMDISDLCRGLAEVLEKTGNDQLRTDQAIEAEIAKLKAGSGLGKGR